MFTSKTFVCTCIKRSASCLNQKWRMEENLKPYAPYKTLPGLALIINYHNYKWPKSVINGIEPGISQPTSYITLAILGRFYILTLFNTNLKHSTYLIVLVLVVVFQSGVSYESQPIIRTLMFMVADHSPRDNKLSQDELTWWFRNYEGMDGYVSRQASRTFIRLLDDDHDGALNADGKWRDSIKMAAPI